jgi:putative ABC transport system substrate-binding protein
MRRREFVIAGVLGCAAPLVGGQGKRVKIGMLNPRPLEKSLVAGPVVRALAELGYRQGDNMQLEYRHTEGRTMAEAALMRELLDLNCDLIFVLGTEHGARALRDARSRTPVVFFAVDYDPLEKAIVSSLRQPGGNMTGVYIPMELAAKKLEIALEVLPTAKRFLVLADPYSKDELARLRAAAQKRSVELTVVEYSKRPYDLAGAFETGKRAGIDGFIGLSSPGFAAQRGALAEQFISHRVPAFVGRLSLVEPGFLVAYTIDLVKAARRVAAIGVKVLKGANPGSIPVEQADEFEIFVNMRMAKILGIKIPASVLARATQMIE